MANNDDLVCAQCGQPIAKEDEVHPFHTATHKKCGEVFAKEWKKRYGHPQAQYIHFMFFNTRLRRDFAHGSLWGNIDDRTIVFRSHNHKISDDPENNLYRLSFETSGQMTPDVKAKVIERTRPYAFLINEKISYASSAPTLVLVNDGSVSCDFCKSKDYTYRWSFEENMGGIVCEKCIVEDKVDLPGIGPIILPPIPD
jgi:hypothetical protein